MVNDDRRGGPAAVCISAAVGPLRKNRTEELPAGFFSQDLNGAFGRLERKI